MRSFLGTLMLVASLATQAGAVPNAVRYACPESELTVDRNASVAHVSFGGRSYDLERKHSSIGDKYISSHAALILDGASAVFVADKGIVLTTCVKADPIASAR
jgi:membrane-bound inhibitor of C-type lysozyme